MNTIIKYTVVTSLLLVFIFIPGKMIMHSDHNFCVFNVITGLQCPLCGMTRAVFEMVHFRFLSALGYNPLAIFLPLMLGIEILYDVTHHSNIGKLRKIVALVFLAGMVFLGAGRLFPGTG